MDTAVKNLLDSLSPYAKKILTVGRDESQQPIRAELFGTKRFEEHGRSLAKAQVIQADGRAFQGPTFFPLVKENIKALRHAYDFIAVTSQIGHYVTPAAQWLLDNFYLIEAQLQEIEDGVPKRYYADLPKLVDKPLAGLPRVYGIAWAYVAHTDSVLDPVLFTLTKRSQSSIWLNCGHCQPPCVWCCWRIYAAWQIRLHAAKWRVRLHMLSGTALTACNYKILSPSMPCCSVLV